MKILYKQNPKENSFLFSENGIKNCYFKRIMYTEHDSDDDYTGKQHYHNGIEIHFITAGVQHYGAENGKTYQLRSGNFLLLPPGVRHWQARTRQDTKKYAISFDIEDSGSSPLLSNLCHRVYFGEISRANMENLYKIEREAKYNRAYSPLIIENRIFEILLILARGNGFFEGKAEHSSDDTRVLLAKAYIADNVDSALSCAEVASYCHLSEKQLSRLFTRFEKITPAAYIAKQRSQRARELLAGELSLSEISERMNFSSEYYFNTFFKKHNGSSPGAYRRTVQSKGTDMVCVEE